jgi:hypothetical protein
MSLTKDLVYLAVLVLLLPLWMALGWLAVIIIGARHLYWWMQSKSIFSRMGTRWTRRTRHRSLTQQSVTPSPASPLMVTRPILAMPSPAETASRA